MNGLSLQIRRAAALAAGGVALVHLAVLPPAAQAGEAIFGVGVDNVGGRPGGSPPSLSVDLRSAPVWRGGAFELALGAGLDADGDGDAWVGVGPALALGARWRIEASVMVGAYGEGLLGPGGNDLGSVFQIRSRGEISRSLGSSRVGLAVAHKSNANLAEENPGVETVWLTWSRPF